MVAMKLSHLDFSGGTVGSHKIACSPGSHIIIYRPIDYIDALNNLTWDNFITTNVKHSSITF